jgi:hypothetical protein
MPIFVPFLTKGVRTYDLLVTANWKRVTMALFSALKHAEEPLLHP